ncbi:MAG: SCO6745 family protein [Acidimicrobiia bacterium]
MPSAESARKTWRTLEPIHGMIYFVPEAAAEYERLGLRGRSGYFASRSAAMGAVGAEMVIATFFNFHPGLVRQAMQDVWNTTSPADVLAARLRGADAALRRLGGELIDSDGVAEAAELSRAAATEATRWPEGRPLFAAHAGLAWPTEPHLVLWHAQTLLREFRGDAHIAALVTAGVTGVEALLLHGASGEVPLAVLQATRAWPDDEWEAGLAGLRERGLIADDDTLTDRGREFRQAIEDSTDRLAAAAYAPIGDEGCARLRDLARPLSKAIVAGGALRL